MFSQTVVVYNTCAASTGWQEIVISRQTRSSLQFMNFWKFRSTHRKDQSTSVLSTFDLSKHKRY